MQVGKVSSGTQHVEHLTDDQFTPAAGHNRHRHQFGQRLDANGHIRFHRLFGDGQRVVQV